MTEKIQQSFTVRFEYEVIFTCHLFDPNNDTLVKALTDEAHNHPSNGVIAIDKGVVDHHPDILKNIEDYFDEHSTNIRLCANPLIVEGGEKVKNSLDGLSRVLEMINNHNIDRHAYVIAIGGGAVLDMAGFAASIAHRGIRHLRIPTTVLAQNDSGIGVKNGINYFGKKNFIGAFNPPYAAINDKHFLTTLDARSWRAGIAEALKVALIKDATFFDWIFRKADLLVKRDLDTMSALVERCAKMHLGHIASSGDPFEKGSSRPLDFGHWAAHKLEQLTKYSILHGEAVALGIQLDVAYSYTIGLIDKATMMKIMEVFSAIGFAHYHKLMTTQFGSLNPELWHGLEEFQEHLGGALTIMLINNIGKGKEVHEIKYVKMEEAVKILKNLG